jgi:hypothetical protein
LGDSSEMLVSDMDDDSGIAFAVSRDATSGIHGTRQKEIAQTTEQHKPNRNVFRTESTRAGRTIGRSSVGTNVCTLVGSNRITVFNIIGI